MRNGVFEFLSRSSHNDGVGGTKPSSMWTAQQHESQLQEL